VNYECLHLKGRWPLHHQRRPSAAADVDRAREWHYRTAAGGGGSHSFAATFPQPLFIHSLILISNKANKSSLKIS
jgi:hypothetical protein